MRFTHPDRTACPDLSGPALAWPGVPHCLRYCVLPKQTRASRDAVSFVSQPRPDEQAEIRQEVAGSVNEHYCKKVLCPGPDYAKRDAAYCEDNNRVSHRIERARI